METREDIDEVEEGRPLKGKYRFKIKMNPIHQNCWSELLNNQIQCCLMLLLIIVLGIEIFKLTIPALPIEEQREISQTILKSIKKISKLVKSHYNISTNDATKHIESLLDKQTATTNLSIFKEY
jgi:hypothetical protein